MTDQPHGPHNSQAHCLAGPPPSPHPMLPPPAHPTASPPMPHVKGPPPPAPVKSPPPPGSPLKHAPPPPPAPFTPKNCTTHGLRARFWRRDGALYADHAIHIFDTVPYSMPTDAYLSTRTPDLVVDVDKIDFVDSATGELGVAARLFLQVVSMSRCSLLHKFKQISPCELQH